MQECWSQDPSKRPSFQHVIIQIRGLLEGAASKQKLQKTLTGTPLHVGDTTKKAPTFGGFGLYFKFGVSTLNLLTAFPLSSSLL